MIIILNLNFNSKLFHIKGVYVPMLEFEAKKVPGLLRLYLKVLPYSPAKETRIIKNLAKIAGNGS